MIYFRKEGEFKVINVTTLEELMEKTKVEFISHADLLVKHLRYNEDVYSFIDPYNSEVNNAPVLDWALTENGAEDAYDSSLGDI